MGIRGDGIMKNVVILEVEKYNELINKLNRLENEKEFSLNQINLWNKKIDVIDEKFRGLFDTIIREDIIGTDEVIISDTNVNICSTALTIINIIRNTTTFITFTANVFAVSYTISFCVFVTASSTYFCK